MEIQQSFAIIYEEEMYKNSTSRFHIELSIELAVCLYRVYRKPK